MSLSTEREDLSSPGGPVISAGMKEAPLYSGSNSQTHNYDVKWINNGILTEAAAPKLVPDLAGLRPAASSSHGHHQTAWNAKRTFEIVTLWASGQHQKELQVYFELVTWKFTSDVCPSRQTLPPSPTLWRLPVWKIPSLMRRKVLFPQTVEPPDWESWQISPVRHRRRGARRADPGWWAGEAKSTTFNTHEG